MPKRKSEGQEGSKSQTEGTSMITDVIAEAYARWINEQQEAQQEYQKRVAYAYLNLIDTIQSVNKEASQPVRDALWKLITVSSMAQSNLQNSEVYQAAYQEYVKALQDYQGSQDIQKQAKEAFENYTQAIIDATAEAQKRSEQAYRDYIRAIKEAWTAIDPDKIEIASFFSAGATASASGQ